MNFNIEVSRLARGVRCTLLEDQVVRESDILVTERSKAQRGLNPNTETVNPTLGG